MRLPRLPRHNRDVSDKRAEIESIARDRVQRSGLRELSFRTLAEDVGVKSSSVHYYFPEKGDLTAALIETYSHEFLGRLDQIAGRGDSLKAELLAFVDLFEQAAAGDRLCLCGMLAAELSALDDASRALLARFFERSETWLSVRLKRRRGATWLKLPPVQLAAVIMAGLEGALLLDRVHGAGVHLNAQRQWIVSAVAEP